MTIGTSNTTELSYIKEVVPGTTPATPAMKRIRFKGESLQGSIQTIESEEITDSRSTADLIPVDQSNGGGINGELSGAAYDDFFAGALFADAAWTATDSTSVTIAAVIDGFTDSANLFVSNGVQAGQFLKVSGFVASNNNGYFRVLTVTANKITTYPAPGTVVAAGASVTYEGSTIKSGKTDHSFTIQKAHRGVTPNVYQNFRGMRVATMTQELAIGRIAEIAFTFKGMTSDVTETQITGRSEVAAPTNGVMNCVSNVTSIMAVGGSFSTPLQFTKLSMAYDNALRELKAIGTLGSVAVRPGTINAQATLNPYFENKEALVAFMNNEAFALFWNLQASDGYGYIFSYPKVKFQAQDLAAGSKDTDMIINGGVRAILDPESLTTCRIDRFLP